jgi:hypothetical protein
MVACCPRRRFEIPCICIRVSGFDELPDLSTDLLVLVGWVNENVSRAAILLRVDKNDERANCLPICDDLPSEPAFLGGPFSQEFASIVVGRTAAWLI